MTVKKTYYKKLSSKLINAFEKRNMACNYFNTSSEAVDYILSQISEKSTVTWGGAMTLEEIGLKEKLKANSYHVLDRDHVSSPEEKEKIQRDTFSADFYLMSSNAITLDGKLLNIDGMGNRIAALIYGPKKVFVVAGINKLTENEETALSRVRQYASPLNAERLNLETPCAKDGICHDCLTDRCICNQILVTRRSYIKDRIHIILIGEELGY